VLGRDIDAVIDAVGIQPTRQLASQMLRPGGCLVHIGLGDADAGIDIRRMTLQELRVTGSYTYTMNDFRETVEAMIKENWGPWIGSRKPPWRMVSAALSDWLKVRSRSLRFC
jgi:threonine dehydrogenase-like Zn-dependent dehydrogenase